jgi:hypothetical protein
MNKKTGRIATVLGAGLVMGLGLLIDAAPASADPPRHAPAWGYRRRAVDRYEPRYRYYQDYDRDGIPNWRDRDIDGDGRRNRYDDHDFRYRPRGEGRRWRVRRDWDGDGVRNRWDRDRDGDGIRNRRDHDRDGDGIRNRRDRHDRNPRRR